MEVMFMLCVYIVYHVMCIPVTAAWCVLRL